MKRYWLFLFSTGKKREWRKSRCSIDEIDACFTKRFDDCVNQKAMNSMLHRNEVDNIS